MVEIPLHGRIAAGTPIEALQDSAMLPVPAALLGAGEHYALEVAGDSMVEAGILDGDTVVIRRCDTADNGDIVVALIDDYEATLREVGIPESVARAQSENKADQMAMPEQWATRFTVRASPIEGRGAFLSESVKAGEYIAPARIDGKRTPAGRFVNHAAIPNARFVKDERGDVHLIALRDIVGCVGGSVGEEITVNYRHALALSGIVSREV